MKITKEQLEDAVYLWWRRGRALNDRPFGDVSTEERIAYHFAEQEVMRLRRTCGEQFAAERGWQVADWFGLQRLKLAKSLQGRRGIEWGSDPHCHYPAINANHLINFYTLDGCAVGIVSHNYDYSGENDKKIEEFVENHKLKREILPWSWYSPSTQASLYTRAPQ